MSSRSLPLIRPLAIPVEHGAWGFLLEPIVLGLLIAPSPAGGLIGLGGLAVFLLRHPLKLAMHDWMHRRYPRTAVCEALVAMYGLAALVTFGAAFSRALIPLFFAVPFGAIQFVYDYRRQNRSLIAELCGAIAPASLVASIVLAAGQTPAVAASLSALMLARAIPSVLYVRSILRGESRTLMLASHAIAIGIAACISWTAVVAMGLLLARAIPSADGTRAQTIGVREIGWGVCTVLLIAISMVSG